MIASPLKTQKRWTPKGFTIDDEYGCLTNSERLEKANPKLRLVVGRTRIIGERKWGDHAWCVTPKGDIIDPYFIWRFPSEWNRIEYVEDSSAFDGEFEEG